jgi:hypothetical protein
LIGLEISNLVLYFSNNFEVVEVEQNLSVDINLVADLSVGIFNKDDEAFRDGVLKVELSGVADEQIYLGFVVS